MTEKQFTSTPEEREALGERAKLHREAGFCDVGSSTDSPCQRPATEKRWCHDEEPTLCPEHLVWMEYGDEANAWSVTLYKIDEWIRGPVSETNEQELLRLALKARDEARREYARAHMKTDAAGLVAHPEHPVLSPEVSEEMTRLITRADAFGNARWIFEELSDGILGAIGLAQDKWLIIDVLADAAAVANEEVASYRREMGLSD